MDNVQKNSITDYNALLSEPFKLHLYALCFDQINDVRWVDVFCVSEC
jgi:hypothetical protein